MAAGLYTTYVTALMTGTAVDLTDGNVKLAFVGSGYTANMSTDQFYSSVSGVIGTPITLASPTVTAGVFDAADPTSAALATGSTISQVVVYHDSGSASTSQLILREDVSPTIPTNGGVVTVAFDNGADKIFAL